MATIVLVHGIGQEQRSADSLEAEWLPDLAGGVRNAGHPDLADAIRASTHTSHPSVRMAFYGTRFLAQGQQGTANSANLTPEQRELAEELARDWLNNATESTDPRDATEACLELHALTRDPSGAQGLRSATRGAVGALDRIPWFTTAGLAATGKLNKTLAQVVHYLTNPDIHEYALTQVRQHLTAATQVVIGHSLGSVIAYEAARELTPDRILPLLLTLGSPLGLSAVNRQLRHPLTYPAQVARWVNLSDCNDIVAARSHQLHAAVAPTRPETAPFDNIHTIDNGARPHNARFYLTKPSCGQPIAETLH
ncbi:MAG TPA: hypothetical protein VLJ59_06210 [Mycobacteriales bacterium]|nr:hypothetical protein [Mycobacteriales bacterium]